MLKPRAVVLWITGLLVIAVPLAAMAQRGGGFFGGGRFGLLPNVPTTAALP